MSMRSIAGSKSTVGGKSKMLNEWKQKVGKALTYGMAILRQVGKYVLRWKDAMNMSMQIEIDGKTCRI